MVNKCVYSVEARLGGSHKISAAVQLMMKLKAARLTPNRWSPSAWPLAAISSSTDKCSDGPLSKALLSSMCACSEFVFDEC